MASFTATPASGIVLPLTVAFDASASSDPEGGALTFAWTFGDGASGTGPTPSHDYTAAGSYNVALTVTDDGGKTATATTTVTAKKKGVRSRMLNLQPNSLRPIPRDRNSTFKT